VVAGPATYRGITVRETSGSAGAVVKIYDNASAGSGTILETIALAQSQSYTVIHPSAVIASAGIYADIVAGAVEGSVYIA
jgi:hypothetical protein